MTTQQWINNFIKTILGVIAALIASVIIGVIIGNLERNWEIAGLICGVISFLYLGYKFLPYDVKVGIKNWNKPQSYQDGVEIAKDFMRNLETLENNIIQNKHIMIADSFDRFKKRLPNKLTKNKFGEILADEAKEIIVFVAEELKPKFYEKLGGIEWIKNMAQQEQQGDIELILPAQLIKDLAEISSKHGLSSNEMTNCVNEIFHGNKPYEEIAQKYNVPMDIISYIVRNAEYKKNDVGSRLEQHINTFFENYMWGAIIDLTDKATILGKEYGFEPPFANTKKTKTKNNI